MRKADYSLLARIIKERHAAAQRLSQSNPTYSARVEEQESIAREFAAQASVDRAAFLKACGIE